MRNIVSTFVAVSTTFAILAFLLPGATYGSPCVRNGSNYCWKCFFDESVWQWKCGEFDKDGFCACEDLANGGCSFNESDWCDYIGDNSCPDPPFCPMFISSRTDVALASLVDEDIRRTAPETAVKFHSNLEARKIDLVEGSAALQTSTSQETRTTDHQQPAKTKAITPELESEAP